MIRIKTQLSVAVAAVLLTAGLAAAQPENQTTLVTFDAPVALPGVTLAPGSYMFKLHESQSNRHIVQVFDKERSKIFATIIAIAAERPQPADETVITFREAPADAPPAIRFWYYPGNTIGHEFAYPKEQAVMIARASGERVLSYETEQGELKHIDATAAAEATASTAPQSKSVETQATVTERQATTKPDTEPAQTPATTSTTAAAETRAGAERQTPATSQPTDAPAASADTQAAGTSGRQLPQTASQLPLVGFVGLLALGGALLARTLRTVL